MITAYATKTECLGSSYYGVSHLFKQFVDTALDSEFQAGLIGRME